MDLGKTSVLSGLGPPSDDAFQRLLLRFSNAASQGTDPAELIRLFCRAAREFWQVDAVYFWRFSPPSELIGTEADGTLAERFRGKRLQLEQASITQQAIQSRKAIYVNHFDPSRSALGGEFPAAAIMAAPLIVSNEVLGAAIFLHSSIADFFTDDMAAKATILAGQAGSLLEAMRLSQAAREERRRAEMLAEVAQTLNTVPDAASVIEGIADRLRLLLKTRLVCILLRQGAGFSLRAVAAETPQMAALVRARHDRKGLQFAADLASRAVAAGEPITAAIDPAAHSLGELIPAGMLVAAPFRTSQTQGAVLVYPRQEGAFSGDEKSLIAVLAGFGAVALANAELCSTARAQAHELHQLLDISSELTSIGDLDQFMQQFALRASDFLGFGRAIIGLLENDAFRVRWSAKESRARKVDALFPGGVATQTLLNREVFWSDDPGKIPGVQIDLVIKHNIRQILAVPLLGSNGNTLGMFAVLDRLDRSGISSEDIRRARVLASHVAMALDVTRTLELSRQHRQSADSLMALALALSSSLRLQDFALSCTNRVAEIMGAPGAALVVQQDQGWEILARKGMPAAMPDDRTFSRRFGAASAEIMTRQQRTVVSATAGEIFGPALAAELDWKDCLLVRLLGGSGEFGGVLCLANREQPLSAEDEHQLQSIAAHASVAFENARLFTRMDRANRHWMEIFDAITDFIVVHDSGNNVLRVNRPLAEFIGVEPKALIGVNMSALLAMDGMPPLLSCPFCRNTGNTGAPNNEDEYIHPALERTYLVSTSRVHGDSDEGLQTIHVLKDISDRREAERRYRELFGNIQEGLFFSTPDGRFVEVNDALVRMLGYSSREELLQADIRSQVYLAPGRFDGFVEQMRELGVVRNYEETLHRKDGATVYVLINAFAVRDGQGRVVQYRGLMLDVSGLKSFQAELQRERDFSGKILNNTQNLILVVDTAGLISYANRRWFDLGYQQRQLLGRPLEELVTSARRQAFREAFAATLQGGHVDNLELQIVRADDRIGQFSINMSPMRDEQGAVTSLVAVMADVTEAAMLQAKLMHAEKMAAVGQLVSGVAHEVNNPLTAILGFADLLMENAELPESARKDLRVILQEAQRTKQIVQNLLSFARQMPPQRKPVQLNTILRRTVQLRAYDFNSHGVEVAEDLDQHLPEVIGDSHQLQQVFLNILNNAYDAVRDCGRPARIEITTTQRGSAVEVWFRDNGHGISQPEKIFDPFFTTKDVGKGTGLGLSICYGIVREHGGEILCHNNADGLGATFIVRLPAASETASVGAAAGVLQR